MQDQFLFYQSEAHSFVEAYGAFIVFIGPGLREPCAEFARSMRQYAERLMVEGGDKIDRHQMPGSCHNRKAVPMGKEPVAGAFKNEFPGFGFCEIAGNMRIAP